MHNFALPGPVENAAHPPLRAFTLTHTQMFTVVAMSLVAVAVAQPPPANRTYVCDHATMRCVQGQSTMGERECFDTCGRVR